MDMIALRVIKLLCCPRPESQSSRHSLMTSITVANYDCYYILSLLTYLPVLYKTIPVWTLNTSPRFDSRVAS